MSVLIYAYHCLTGSDGGLEFQFSWWAVLNLTWFWHYYTWDIFEAAKSLLKYCRKWSRASFVGDNNRMRLFRLKWVNIWKIPLLIIRPCLREADWCCLYQMVCSMRLSPSAPVHTPDGGAAWGKTRGCSQERDVGTKSPHWEKHSQGFQLKMEEKKHFWERYKVTQIWALAGHLSFVCGSLWWWPCPQLVPSMKVPVLLFQGCELLLASEPWGLGCVTLTFVL